MRSMKKSEIKILSLAKFTAAIDVGIWSENNNYSDPKEFYKDYENLTPEPKVIFRLHESNFQQFLDVDSIRSIFSKKIVKNQKFNSFLQDLMVTLPTILIILNRKEEALYAIERCLII